MELKASYIRIVVNNKLKVDSHESVIYIAPALNDTNTNFKLKKIFNQSDCQWSCMYVARHFIAYRDTRILNDYEQSIQYIDGKPLK